MNNDNGLKIFISDSALSDQDQGSRGIPLSSATIEPFPSGLVRVEQAFLVKISDVSDAREVFAMGNRLFDNSNKFSGFDGPFIFPGVREVYDVPGFCKFIVSAYGYSRKFNEFIETKGFQIVTISKSYTVEVEEPDPENPPGFITTPDGVQIPTEGGTITVTYTWTINEKWQVGTSTAYGVMGNTATGPYYTGTVPSPKLVSRTISGEVGPDGPSEITISWPTEIVGVSRRNFGTFDEYAVTSSPVPYY